eukprot:SAG11_NODE_6858_length_1234_cov_5.890749_2_plen_58_part_00
MDEVTILVQLHGAKDLLQETGIVGLLGTTAPYVRARIGEHGALCSTVARCPAPTLYY